MGWLPPTWAGGGRQGGSQDACPFGHVGPFPQSFTPGGPHRPVLEAPSHIRQGSRTLGFDLLWWELGQASLVLSVAGAWGPQGSSWEWKVDMRGTVNHSPGSPQEVKVGPACRSPLLLPLRVPQTEWLKQQTLTSRGLEAGSLRPTVGGFGFPKASLPGCPLAVPLCPFSLCVPPPCCLLLFL